MQHPFGLQGSDLEAIPSVVEQKLIIEEIDVEHELTNEEAEKIVGGATYVIVAGVGCACFPPFSLPHPANPPSPPLPPP